MTDRDAARAAKQHLRARLAALDGVGGVGIGRRHGSYVVTVDVAEETVVERVPSSWDGVDVEVRVVGRVRPLTPGNANLDGEAGQAATSAPEPGTDAAPVPGWRLVGRDGSGSGR